MNVFERRLLQTLLVQPTAPFREHYVRAVIESAARKLDLRTRRDRFGNVYVTYRQGRANPIAFTAHMDHPGFEVLAAGRRPRARSASTSLWSAGRSSRNRASPGTLRSCSGWKPSTLRPRSIQEWVWSEQ